jgi:hypothetical protein
MRKLILLSLFLAFSISLMSQDVIDKVVVTINTIGENEVLVKIYPSLSKDQEIAFIRTLSLNQELKLGTVNNKEAAGKLKKNEQGCGDKFISLKMKGIDDSFLELLGAAKSDFFLYADKDFKIYTKEGVKTDSLIISQKELRDKTERKIFLGQSQLEELKESLAGTGEILENAIDAGVSPNLKDQKDLEYYASFTLYSPIKSIKIKDKSPYLSLSGRISTKIENPMNYIKFYPFSYSLFDFKDRSEFKFSAGIEGNQDFSVLKYTVNLNWQTLVPWDIIDLAGGSNRIKLFPVFSLGAKYYKADQNMLQKQTIESIFQVNASLYYYIPILENYSLMLEGQGFFDFDKTLNPNDLFRYSYSATLGYRVPGSDLKVIGKYHYGENDLTYTIEQSMMFGFIMDLFKVKDPAIRKLF